MLKLVAGLSVIEFKWADWIDSAMGFLKGIDDHLERNNLGQVPEHILYWRKRTPSKCDLTRPLLTIPKGHPEFPQLKGDIRIWTGWPFFDIKLVHFEMNQCLNAAGLMRGFRKIHWSTAKDWETKFKEEVKCAEEGLQRITEWNRKKA